MHHVTNVWLGAWRRRSGRGWLGWFVGLAAASLLVPAQAQPGSGRLPQCNLLVEVRQIDEGQLGAQGGGLERGAVVVGSDGRVSGGADVGWQVSTREHRDAIAQQLRVLNGGRASMRLSRSVPLQWWQAVVTPQGVQAVPTTVFSDAGQGFAVRPSWPGGRAPVTVEVQTEMARAHDPDLTVGDDPDNGIARERFTTLTTLQFPLGEWVTVASSGQDGAHSERGVLSTRDVGRRSQIVVQMRITAP